MIERFQQIKNIGTFKDAKIAKYQFNKLTLVYGANSQGKSTLCDIIKSLSGNAPEYIKERKTVGAISEPQVEISFGNGKSAKFSSNVWTVSENVLESKNIYVFDNEFVQSNVFTNSTIDHKNKECFTKFILGSESVDMQKKLNKLKIEKLDLDNANELIEKNFFAKFEMPVNNFINIPYKVDVHNEDEECLACNQSIKDLKQDIKNIEKIKELSLPETISYVDAVVDSYKKLNKIFELFYEFSNNDIISRFNDHKKLFKKMPIEFDKWVSEGTQIQNSSKCPFCGEETSNNLLVQSYITLFCKEFIEFSKKIDELKTIDMTSNCFLKLKLFFSENESKIEKIGAKVYLEEVSTILTSFRNDKIKLIEIVVKYEEMIQKYNEIFMINISNKISNRYIKISAVNIEEIENLLTLVTRSFTEYNRNIQNFNAFVKKYFENLTAEGILKQITKFENKYKELSSIVNRYKYNELVIEYNNNAKNSKNKLIESKRLKMEFESAQDIFINTFYEDINKYFGRLGSEKYRIEKQTNNQGTNKVYSLKLFFSDKEVRSERIQYVLSDSDKRALALSIFLSKLKHKINLEDAIVVLDDPITSFDNERMTLFINILKELNKTNQIIILTHYRDFYKKTVELMYASQPLPSLLKIVFLPEGNSLDWVDKFSDPLLMGDYEKYLQDMSLFIQGKTHTYSSVNARFILQKHLEYKFYHEIKIKNIKCDNLKGFISDLQNNKLIKSADIYVRLNAKREEYNIDSHYFDNQSEESKRYSIKDLENLLNLI